MGDVVKLLDPGVRFVPTDEELVMEYLVKAATGEALPGNYVIEQDLYADKAPWEILMTTTNNHEGGQGQGGVDVVDHHLPWMTIRSRDQNSGRIKTESTIYVLTALKKASRSGNRIGRRAGCGGWHGENGNKIMEVETGRVIGYKRMFTFEVQEESVSRDIEMGLMIQNHWIMHEYTLDYDDPTTTCGGFAICKLVVDDSKKVKIAPKSRMRRKTAHLCSGSNIQVATKKVASEDIHEEDNEYHHSMRRKRMRCVDTQADEEGNNYSDPQRRKKMPPLELAKAADHDNRQQPTAITSDDGNALLTLVQEESTTKFGVDFDLEVDQFVNPVMWPASEPNDQFTPPWEEDQEKRLQEEANITRCCKVVPNLDSATPPDATLLQQPTSTSNSTSFPCNFTSFPHMNESDDDHFNSNIEAAAVVRGQLECSTTMVNNSGAELRNELLDLDVEKEAAVPTPKINYVDDVAGQYTWVPLPQQLPPVLQEEEFSEICLGDLWSY